MTTTDTKHARHLAWPFAAARGAYRTLARRLLDPNRVVLRQIENRGLKLLVWQNEDIGRRLIFLKRFEDAELDFVLGHIRPGDVCVDVGGNIGYFALPMARACHPGGSVVCFEPLHRNVLTIQLAAELNRLSNLEVIEAAVVDVPRTLTMTIPGADSAYAHVDVAPEKPGGVAVAGVTLDDVVYTQSPDRVTFLKIDVEGAEDMVLAGAARLFADPARRPKFMMIELVPSYLARFGASVDGLVARLAAHDYAPFVLASGRLRPLLPTDHGQLINTFFLDHRMRTQLSL